MHSIVRIVAGCVKEEILNPVLHNGINGAKSEDDDGLPGDEEYNDEDGQGENEEELIDAHSRYGEPIEDDFGDGGDDDE